METRVSIRKPGFPTTDENFQENNYDNKETKELLSFNAITGTFSFPPGIATSITIIKNSNPFLAIGLI